MDLWSNFSDLFMYQFFSPDACQNSRYVQICLSQILYISLPFIYSTVNTSRKILIKFLADWLVFQEDDIYGIIYCFEMHSTGDIYEHMVGVHKWVCLCACKVALLKNLRWVVMEIKSFEMLFIGISCVCWA